MPLLVRVVAAVVVARFSRLTIDHATADLTSALARRPIGERRFWLRARELLSPHRFVWAFSFGRFRLYCFSLLAFLISQGTTEWVKAHAHTLPAAAARASGRPFST